MSPFDVIPVLDTGIQGKKSIDPVGAGIGAIKIAVLCVSVQGTG
jgi:hypothetical protein